MCGLTLNYKVPGKKFATDLSLCNMYVDTDWELWGVYLDPIVQFDFVYQYVVDSKLKMEG